MGTILIILLIIIFLPLILQVAVLAGAAGLFGLIVLIVIWAMASQLGAARHADQLRQLELKNAPTPMPTPDPTVRAIEQTIEGFQNLQNLDPERAALGIATAAAIFLILVGISKWHKHRRS